MDRRHLHGPGEPTRALTLAAASSRTTHAPRTCLDTCRYMAAILIGAAAETVLGQADGLPGLAVSSYQGP